MFITKFSGKILGVRGYAFRLHNEAGEVVGVYATQQEAEAAKAVF